MAIQRIRINDTASASGAYTFALNPSSLELNADIKQSEIETLDGGIVQQEPFFDSRPYIAKWSSVQKGVITNFGTMISTIKGYKNNIKYVHFGTADYAYPTLGWTKVRVGNCRITVDKGGKIKYNVELTLYPEP